MTNKTYQAPRVRHLLSVYEDWTLKLHNLHFNANDTEIDRTRYDNPVRL